MDFDFIVEHKGLSLDPKEMWFLPLTNQRDPSALGLRIGLKDFVPSTFQIAVGAAREVLEKGLGKDTVATEVQHIEVAALPENPKKEGYVEMTAIADFISWRKTHKCEPAEAPSE